MRQVVVGNDPVWSVGIHGPSWGLVERLLPAMDAAGVALYISGRDLVMQARITHVLVPKCCFQFIVFPQCAPVGKGMPAVRPVPLPGAGSDLIGSHRIHPADVFYYFFADVDICVYGA